MILGLSATRALADPVPAVTPFEGAWVSVGRTDACEDTKQGAPGDGFLIEGRTIGAGDSVCTLEDMTVRGRIHFFRMQCHGLNRSYAGTKYIRIDVIDAERIRFRHQGEAPGEMQRCP
jgi:hypothetical protein